MALDETPGSITEPQAKYIDGLVKKKDLIGNVQWTPTADQLEYLRAGDYSSMSKAQASKAIEQLLKLDDKPDEPSIQDLVDHDATRLPDSDYSPPVHGVGEQGAGISADNREAYLDEIQGAGEKLESDVGMGHYFIVDPKDGEEKFFKVTKGREGTRWEGYTFLEVRGGDFWYPCKSQEYKDRIFAEIVKDPVTAMNEYGMRLGKCGMCGRTLTARDSRLRGIGPICAATIMMEEAQATPEQLDMLTKLGIRKD